MTTGHIDGLVQERRTSIANAYELRLPCTKPSIYSTTYWNAEVTLGLPLTNERRPYKVTPSLIGWAQT